MSPRKPTRNLNVIAHHVAVAMSRDLTVRLLCSANRTLIGKVVSRRIDPDLDARRHDPQIAHRYSNLVATLDTGEQVNVEDIGVIERV